MPCLNRRMKHSCRAAVAGLFVFAVLSVARGATFESLLLGFDTNASGISADGSAVVGGYSVINGGSHAYRWTACGAVGLRDLASGTTNGYDVSGDGSVVVGFSGADAFRWTPAGCITGLGLINAVATNVSDDGTLILGYGRLHGQFSPIQAFSKTGNGPVTSFDFPDYLSINAISRDNSIVVGGGGPAYRWTSATGAVQLPDLDPGSETSIAWDISADGSVITGTSVAATGEVHLITWTGPDNTITDLGILASRDGVGASADATNSDGSVIVGEAVTTLGSRNTAYAFIWDAAHGIRNLQDVLTNEYGLGSQLTNLQLTDATGISDDGNVIAGNGVYTNSDFTTNNEVWRVTFGATPLALCGASSRASQNGTSYNISLVCGIALTPTTPTRPQRSAVRPKRSVTQVQASAASTSGGIIECRSGDGSGDGNYTLGLSFSNSLASVAGASASESGCGTIGVSGGGINGSDYVVHLTGVCNGQDVTVSLTDVNDSNGGHLDTVTSQMPVLIGDTNGDGFVNSADIGQTKAQSGQPLGTSNFREDVDRKSVV